MSETSSRCVLAGYFGFGNAGDEIILEVLRSKIPSVSWTILSRRVLNPFRLAWTLRAGRALVLGGGELFQTRTSLRSLLYYLGLIVLARLVGRAVVAYGIGVDPRLPRGFRGAVRNVLGKARAVWVRDEVSAEVLGLPQGSVVPDSAWAWEKADRKPEAGRSHAALPRNVPNSDFPPLRACAVGGGRQKTGTLWILRLSSDEDAAEWSAVLNGLADKENHAFMPFHPAQDSRALSLLRARLDFPHSLETWDRLDEISEIFVRYQVVVSMRYHGLLLAALSGRACAAVADHGKVAQLARDLGVPGLERRGLEISSLDGLLRKARTHAPDRERVRAFREEAERGLRELSRRLSLSDLLK